MHDSGAMRAVESVGDGDADGERKVERQGARIETVRQRLTVQELHHQVVGAVHGAHVVDGADVRMTQRGQGSGFALEALPQVRIVAKCGGRS